MLRHFLYAEYIFLFQVFLKYLLDADWSVCAGNWMWVSSSAFEKVLQCPKCFCPVGYGRRMDRNGEYIRYWFVYIRRMFLIFEHSLQNNMVCSSLHFKITKQFIIKQYKLAQNMLFHKIL